jgi:hypothetical protein
VGSTTGILRIHGAGAGERRATAASAEEQMRPRSRMRFPTWPLKCPRSARRRQRARTASSMLIALAVATVLGRANVVLPVHCRAGMVARSTREPAPAPALLVTSVPHVRTMLLPGGSPKMVTMRTLSLSGSCPTSRGGRISPDLRGKWAQRGTLRSVEAERESLPQRGLLRSLSAGICLSPISRQVSSTRSSYPLAGTSSAHREDSGQ